MDTIDMPNTPRILLMFLMKIKIMYPMFWIKVFVKYDSKYDRYIGIFTNVKVWTMYQIIVSALYKQFNRMHSHRLYKLPPP